MKITYRLVSLGASLASGLIAGALFKQLWRLAAREDEAPKATDADRGWGEILTAAALQGAVFALVKAVVDRGAAEGAKAITGTWPGEHGEDRR
jgi:hypothetical protein